MADQPLTRRVTGGPRDTRMELSFICDGNVQNPVVVHDFSNTSEWKIHVQVTQHDDEPDDTNGEVLEPTKLEPGARHYTVIAMRHVQVVLKNQSTTTPLKFKPVWVSDDGDQFDEEAVELGLADTTIAARKLHSFRKDYAEDTTSWLLKDLDGRHVLSLHFHVED